MLCRPPTSLSVSGYTYALALKPTSAAGNPSLCSVCSYTSHIKRDEESSHLRPLPLEIKAPVPGPAALPSGLQATWSAGKEGESSKISGQREEERRMHQPLKLRACSQLGVKYDKHPFKYFEEGVVQAV
jgi:hypothetical protein